MRHFRAPVCYGRPLYQRAFSASSRLQTVPAIDLDMQETVKRMIYIDEVQAMATHVVETLDLSKLSAQEFPEKLADGLEARSKLEARPKIRRQRLYTILVFVPLLAVVGSLGMIVFG